MKSSFQRVYEIMYDCKYLQVEDITNGNDDVFDHLNYKYVCTKKNKEIIPYIHCNKKRCISYSGLLQHKKENK